MGPSQVTVTRSVCIWMLMYLILSDASGLFMIAATCLVRVDEWNAGMLS